MNHKPWNSCRFPGRLARFNGEADSTGPERIQGDAVSRKNISGEIDPELIRFRADSTVIVDKAGERSLEFKWFKANVLSLEGIACSRRHALDPAQSKLLHGIEMDQHHEAGKQQK